MVRRQLWFNFEFTVKQYNEAEKGVLEKIESCISLVPSLYSLLEAIWMFVLWE
jgi:hypothetical protein